MPSLDVVRSLAQHRAMIAAPLDPELRALVSPEEDSVQDPWTGALERIALEDDDLVCGPSGLSGPWRLSAAAGGRQLNDREFEKPLELDWSHFCIEVMREVLAGGASIHFDLTQMRGLPDLLEAEGEWGATITAHELRWLRQRWDRGDGGIVFWTAVEYRDDGAWGRQVEAPWEWSKAKLAIHNERFAEEDEDSEEIAA